MPSLVGILFECKDVADQSFVESRHPGAKACPVMAGRRALEADFAKTCEVGEQGVERRRRSGDEGRELVVMSDGLHPALTEVNEVTLRLSFTSSS